MTAPTNNSPEVPFDDPSFGPPADWADDATTVMEVPQGTDEDVSGFAATAHSTPGFPPLARGDYTPASVDLIQPRSPNRRGWWIVGAVGTVGAIALGSVLVVSHRDGGETATTPGQAAVAPPAPESTPSSTAANKPTGPASTAVPATEAPTTTASAPEMSQQDLDKLLGFGVVPLGFDAASVEPSKAYKAQIQQIIKDNPVLAGKDETMNNDLSKISRADNGALPTAWGTCVRVDVEMTDKTGKTGTVPIEIVNPMFDTDGTYTQYFGKLDDANNFAVTIQTDKSGNVVAGLPTDKVQVTRLPGAKEISLYNQAVIADTAADYPNVNWQKTGFLVTMTKNGTGNPVVVAGVANLSSSFPDSQNTAICSALQSRTGKLS